MDQPITITLRFITGRQVKVNVPRNGRISDVEEAFLKLDILPKHMFHLVHTLRGRSLIMRSEDFLVLNGIHDGTTLDVQCRIYTSDVCSQQKANDTIRSLIKLN